MNPGESATKTAAREAREETGREVEAVNLIGMYAKYLVPLANGDKYQTVGLLFYAKVIVSSIEVDRQKIFELDYLSPKGMLILVCKQHNDMLCGRVAGRLTVSGKFDEIRNLRCSLAKSWLLSSQSL